MAAKLEEKRPLEFLRQAAEDEARAVIGGTTRARLKRLLAELPPGTLGEDDAAELGAAVKRALRGEE